MQDFEASVLAAADAMVGAAPPASAPAEVVAAPAVPEPAPTVAPVVEATPAASAAPVVEAQPDSGDKLAALAKQEQESRAEKFRQERLQFQKEREDLEKAKQDLSRFDKNKSSLKEQLLTDPVGFAKEFGLDPNDLAKRIWEKQIGEVKDKTSEKVYGVEAQLERVTRELAEMKEEAAQKEQASAQQRAADEYKAQLVSGLDEVVDSLPHVKPFLDKRKNDIHGDLFSIAVEMHKADPETPVTPSRVYSELEKRLAAIAPARMQQLEEELTLWRQAGTKPAPGNSGKTNASPTGTPTLSNQLAGATERKSVPQTEDERLADAIAFVQATWAGAASS